MKKTSQTSLDRLREGRRKASAPAASRATRGKRERVAVAVRLDHQQWALVHEMALAHRISINQLCIDGINALRAKEGLRPI